MSAVMRLLMLCMHTFSLLLVHYFIKSFHSACTAETLESHGMRQYLLACYERTDGFDANKE